MLSCEHRLCPANRGQCPRAWLHTNQNGIVDSFLKNTVFHNNSILTLWPSHCMELGTIL